MHRIDLRIVTRGGDTRWIGHVCQPVYGADGAWLGTRGSNRDITDRKHAEARQAELLEQVRAERDVTATLAARIEREWNLLETIMDNTATGLAYLDPEFNFVRVNQAYAAQSGYHPAEMIGRNHFGLFPHDENRAIFERVRDSGEAAEFKAREFEHANQPQRGVTYWDWTLVPVKDQVGGVRGLVLSLTDATGRVHAARQQERHLSRLHTLLECAREVVAEQTVAGLLQRVIDAARELTEGQIGTAGYGYRTGTFLVAASSRAAGAPQCPAGETFRTERGGVYLDILNSPVPLQWSDDELRSHPQWWGLPDGHAPLRGLLGARLVGRDGQADGLIMVTDKVSGGEFTAEDAAVLGHLAALASIALQQIEARHDAERRAAELDAVFEAMVDSVIVYDAAGIPVRANRAALDLHGLDPVGIDRQVLAHRMGIVHPDGSPVDLEQTTSSRALRGERVAGERFVYTTAAGQTRYVVTAGAPMSDDGKILGAVVVWHDVTDREQLLAENRRQREFLERLIDSAPIGIAVVSGPEQRYEMVNEAYRAIVPSPDVPVLGRPVAEVFPGAMLDLLDEVYRTRCVVSFREQAVTLEPGREVTYWNGDHVPLCSPNGEVERIVILAHQVTEQVRARRRIEEISAQAQQRADELDAVFDAMADAVVVVDAEGVAIKANPAALELAGEDPVGHRWAHYVQALRAHRSDRQLVSTDELAMTRALAGETVREHRFSIVDRLGRAHTVLVSGGPLRDRGEVTGAVMVWHDVTRAERAERARDQLIGQLEAERARLKAILDNAPEGIVVADEEGRILFTNPAADRLYAHPVPFGQAYDSHAVFEVCAPDGTPYQPRDLPLTRSALDGETWQDLAMSIAWPDGQRRHILVNTSPIVGSEGRVTGAVGVF
ncbi:MAG TPA: PAS domain-containing protein, partial [Anaerolineae bacterium]|nr:PAS domain-containing protein [Anaerolineae bacterium]